MVLLDCASGVEKLEDGFYRIRIYDPNFPYLEVADEEYQENYLDFKSYHDHNKEKCAKDCKEKKHHTWEWRTSRKGSLLATLHGKVGYGEITQAWAYRLDTEIAKDFFKNGFKYDFSPRYETIWFDADTQNFELSNLDYGSTLALVTNDELVNIDKKFEFTSHARSAEVKNDNMGFNLSGPKGAYEISFSNGVVIIRCNDNMNIIETNGQVTFTMNEENDTLSITADNDSNVEVIQENIFDRDVYTAVTLEGDMKAGQTVEVSLDDNDNFSVSASEGVVMDMEVESTKSKNKEFKAEDVVLGDAEYALQDVLSGKTEVTSQPVETPTEQPSQPDTSGNDKPAVKKDTTTASGWAKSTLDLAYEAGIVPALTGDPAFKAAITREQFAELAVAMVSAVCGRPELTGEKTFSDCINPDVLLAAEMGIVSGVGNGKFDPKTTTNREQIAAMVDRAINYINEQKGIDLTPAASDISKFADKNQVSSWAAESVGTLAANGIMSGTSATTLSPKDSCTVEQSIMLLYRVYEAAK